jgi:hypothetical protein
MMILPRSLCLPVVAPFPYLSKIQPLLEYLQQLRQEGLTGIHLLWMYFIHRIQPLQVRKTKIWVYPGSSCPDCPSPEELSVVEVKARICKVLDSVVTLSPDAVPDPLQRGIASVRVSILGPIPVAFMILSFHCARDLVQGLGDGCNESRDADAPVDASGWEVRHASNGAARACEERERDRCATSQAMRKRGTEVPTRSASSGEGEMERRVTPPSLSPSHVIYSQP